MANHRSAISPEGAEQTNMRVRQFRIPSQARKPTTKPPWEEINLKATSPIMYTALLTFLADYTMCSVCFEKKDVKHLYKLHASQVLQVAWEKMAPHLQTTLRIKCWKMISASSNKHATFLYGSILFIFIYLLWKSLVITKELYRNGGKDLFTFSAVNLGRMAESKSRGLSVLSTAS